MSVTSRRFAFILILVVVATAHALPCFHDLKLDDNEATVQARVDKLLENARELSSGTNSDANNNSDIKNTGNTNASAIPFECLTALHDRGFYKAAISLFEDYFLLHKIDIFEDLNQHITSKRKNLEKFYTKMLTSRQQVQQIEPVVIWAQSKNNVFIQMKLALRRDAPACLNCEQEKIEVLENHLSASFFGLLSHQPIRWLLELTLERAINVEESYYQAEAVGTYFFNLSKAVKNELWRDLSANNTANATKKKSTHHIWWELRDRYGEDMDEWIRTLEEEEIAREDQEQEERERLRQIKRNQTLELQQQQLQQQKLKQKQKRLLEKQQKQAAAQEALNQQSAESAEEVTETLAPQGDEAVNTQTEEESVRNAPQDETPAQDSSVPEKSSDL